MTDTFHTYSDARERGVACDDRIAYELIVRVSKAARLRAFDAIVKYKCAVTDTYTLQDDCIVILVWIDPAKQVAFVNDCKPFEMKYRPPHRFDNGTLIPKFHSPEAELEDRRQRHEAEQAARVLGGSR